MLSSQEIVLPCGLKLPNRLVKAALAEGMAAGTHAPDDKFLIAYGDWAKGGWGMVLTGNVQVSEHFLGGPDDVQIPSKIKEQTKKQWKEWAETCQQEGTPTCVQLCHPGRQSPFGSGDHSFFAKTLAPSAVPLTLGSGLVARAAAALLFGTPKAMTKGEINMAIEQFVQGAKLAYDSGFKGVELHGAHGYLITQFLSSSTNLRTDEFGGTAAKRAELVLRIIKRIRSSTSKEFCIGIKLNSVDASTETLADVLEQIGLIEDAGIDFMELSGGTYSSPEMMKEPESRPKGSTLKREAFFLEFAQTVREHFPKLTLMVTGGFRTRIGIESALKSGACDLIGIGRPGAVLPHLPKDIILNETVKDEDASVVLKPLVLPMWINWTPITAVGAGYQSYYYASQIQRMGKGLQPIDTRA